MSSAQTLITGELSGSRSKWFHSTVPRIFSGRASGVWPSMFDAPRVVALSQARLEPQ